MRGLMVAAALVALAGCNSGAPGSGGGATRSDGEIQMKAGKWTQSMVIEKFDIPGAPPEAKGMLDAMIGKTQTSESCMTQDQVDKGWAEQAKKSMQSEQCKTEDFSAEGGKLKGRIACDSGKGAKATMTLDGTYTPEQMAMTMTADISDPSMPGGKGQMVMKMTGKRVGECDK